MFFFYSLGNIIPLGFLEIPFFKTKKNRIIFPLYIVIFKGNYLTCHVRHTKYKSGNTLSRRWSIIWLMFIHIIFFHETLS